MAEASVAMLARGCQLPEARKSGTVRLALCAKTILSMGNPAARAQMRAEVAAQFAAFAATGLPLDHVNAHKHFHLHPMIASAILDAGAALGIPAMRVPVEHGTSGMGAAAMRWWAGLLGRRLRRRGIVVNDQVIGLAQTGAFTPEAMQTALAALPDGLTELYTHPATADIWPGSAPGYRYRAELAALTAPATRAALVASGAQAAPFAHWAPSHPAQKAA